MHGPHNQQFHALWNQLRDEHEELVIKGYTGEGFLSQGKRLGGARIPMDEARRRARASAERRRVIAKDSGRRLGGAPVLRGTDMRKLRADAAQRRIEVMNGCASGTEQGTELAEEASRNGFKTQAEEDDANERAILQAFIELIQEEEREKYGSSYVPPSQENPAGPRTCAPTGQPAHDDPIELLSCGESSAPMGATSSSANNSSYEAPWTCPTCTLENPPSFLCCDACASERPIPSHTISDRTSESGTSPQSIQSEPQKQKKRVLQETLDGTRDERPPRDTFAFKNRTSALDSLKSLDRDVNKRPLGWVCTCGTFMEAQWWTCSLCGQMKSSS